MTIDSNERTGFVVVDRLYGALIDTCHKTV